MSLTSASDHAGEPYHCCRCGVRDPRCLCQRCREEFSVNGVLPDWLRELKNAANRETERDRRNRERLVRPPQPPRNNGNRPPTPLVPGVSFRRLGEDW